MCVYVCKYSVYVCVYTMYVLREIGLLFRSGADGYVVVSCHVYSVTTSVRVLTKTPGHSWVRVLVNF